jgi:hypothetical protein
MKGKCNPLKMAFGNRTCRSNLLSTINNCLKRPSHLLDIFNLIIKMLGTKVNLDIFKKLIEKTALYQIECKVFQQVLRVTLYSS